MAAEQIAALLSVGANDVDAAFPSLALATVHVPGAVDARRPLPRSFLGPDASPHVVAIRERGTATRCVELNAVSLRWREVGRRALAMARRCAEPVRVQLRMSEVLDSVMT